LLDSIVKIFLFSAKQKLTVQLFSEAGKITGRTFRVYDIMRKGIEDAGFVNIVEKTFKTPLGRWPTDPKMRDLGQWAELGFDVGLEGYAMATFTRVMGSVPVLKHRVGGSPIWNND
jgi:hypothetical protein